MKNSGWSTNIRGQDRMTLSTGRIDCARGSKSLLVPAPALAHMHILGRPLDDIPHRFLWSWLHLHREVGLITPDPADGSSDHEKASGPSADAIHLSDMEIL
jgi:hypothetical protein